MRIAYIGNYPPRACGIGTFTANLVDAVAANLSLPGDQRQVEIIAINDREEGYDYPAQVSLTIQQQNREDYVAAAHYLNRAGVDLVVLQHEYGIFGGQDGAYILSLLNLLQKPLVTTFHTVLKTPSFSQKAIMEAIVQRSQSVVVMSRLACTFLGDIYDAPSEKIRCIEHGVPSLETADREDLRQRFGFDGRRVLFTFGFLGRGKGIETVIHALPKVVERFPDLLYMVLGKTHPNVLRESGEEYRQYLLDLVSNYGLENNVQLVNEFADEQTLFEYLKACDIYVTPYLNEAQITSGTLSYAIGAGAAVLSTPYWHAQELLDEGRGLLFPFKDSERLTDLLSELLADAHALERMRQKAFQYGKRLKWNLIGKEYLRVFRSAVRSYAKLKDEGAGRSLPPVAFRHLYRMTDSTGIIQHAKYAIPNRFEGYCLDDNARALLTVAMALQNNMGTRQRLLPLADTYLAYLYHAQREDGWFRNFMSYDRRFLDDHGSEDAFARAVWACGYALRYPLSDYQEELTLEILLRALPHLEEFTSPRATAYSLIGLCHWLHTRPGDEGLLAKVNRMAQRLVELFQASSHDDWRWFEPYLTYSNATLPLALYHVLEWIPDENIRQTAEQATAFLEKITLSNGYLCPVGCEAVYEYGGERSRFDQQPIDVVAQVLLYEQAFRVTGNRHYAKCSLLCFEWFFGRNDLGLPLYDAETGGCCDGLTALGVNRNQGAESLLSYLIARLTVAGVQQQSKEEKLEVIPGPAKIPNIVPMRRAERQSEGVTAQINEA